MHNFCRSERNPFQGKKSLCREYPGVRRDKDIKKGDVREKLFMMRVVKQVAWRDGRYPIPDNIQGQFGWGSQTLI